MSTIATEKQNDFISRLMGERDYHTLNVGNILQAQERGLTKTEASTLITLLMGCPKRSQGTVKAVEEGFYILDDMVYRVQKAKSSGNLYAKILKPVVFGTAHWEYAPGMMRKLGDAQKLTVEVAASMGHHYGVCMICGRTLTAEESVQAGIGPICAGKI